MTTVKHTTIEQIESVSRKIREHRERLFARWTKPTHSFTIYVHAFQTPMGRIETVERFDKKKYWVALTLNSLASPDSPGRYHEEVFGSKDAALRSCQEYFDRQRARTGCTLTAAYVVPTVVVRKRKITSTPIEFQLAEPKRIED